MNKKAAYILFSICCACSTDYRTDYEINNGIELTPEQIEVRKNIERSRIEGNAREAQRTLDRMRMQRMVRCNAGHYLDCYF